MLISNFNSMCRNKILTLILQPLSFQVCK